MKNKQKQEKGSVAELLSKFWPFEWVLLNKKIHSVFNYHVISTDIY